MWCCPWWPLGVYDVFLTAQMGRYSNLYTEREIMVIHEDDVLVAEEPRLPPWKAATLLVIGLLVVCVMASRWAS